MNKVTKVEAHEHQWVENYCSCGAVAIPYRDFAIWKSEWNLYYEKVKKSESMQIFTELAAAAKEKNTELVRKLHNRVRKIAAEGNWIPKPTCCSDDPELLRRQKKIVVTD